MDGQRFDELTRALAKGTSRRRVLKGLAGGAVGGMFVALGATRVQQAAAQAVPCTTGTDNACPTGYKCCPTTNTPGGPGICGAENVDCPPVGGEGDPCTTGTDNACNSGLTCCPTGSTPGGAGVCHASCGGEGDPCTTGTDNACNDGLQCCSTGGAPGSQGVCHATCPSAGCAGAGDTCSSDADCCAGKCDPDQKICYCSDPARPVVGCPCTPGSSSTCGGSPDLCCSDGTCASPMVGCNPTGGGEGDPCTTGTQNPCNDGLKCCPTTTRAGGPGVCTSSDKDCPPVLPNTGSGGATAERAGWVTPAALLGAGAALVAAKRRRASASEPETE